MPGDVLRALAMGNDLPGEGLPKAPILVTTPMRLARPRRTWTPIAKAPKTTKKTANKQKQPTKKPAKNT